MDWNIITDYPYKKEEFIKYKDKSSSITSSEKNNKWTITANVWIFNPGGFEDLVYKEVRVVKTKKDVDVIYKKLKKECNEILKKWKKWKCQNSK